MKPLAIALLLLSVSAVAQTAAELEAQYKTCAKHYIPADKCTPEIYRELKAKDEAPPDAKTAIALKAVKEYRSHLKNPESMQVRTAFLTDDGAMCFEIGGQNGLGGVTVARAVYITDQYKAKRLRGHWLDENGFFGQEDRWPGVCQKMGAFGKGGAMKPGTDVTEKVNAALKDTSSN